MMSVFPFYALAVTLLMTWPSQFCDADEFELTILHTNDIHAHYEQFNKYGSSCSDADASAGKCYGGYARLQTAVKQYRQQYPNSLLLSGGDQYQGTLWFYKYGGNVTYHFMNWVKYDVMAIGNHEFDRGVAGLVPFLQNVQFDVVNANIDASAEPSMAGLFTKSTERTVAGRRIGIVGYTTVDTPLISHTGNLVFKDVITEVKKEVDRLKADGVKLIIALGHAGFGVDKDVAKIPGVDIVIGGHSHSFLYSGTPPSNDKPVAEYPFVVTRGDGSRALVAQCFYMGKYLCILHVRFNDNGDIVSYTGSPQLQDSSVRQDNATLQEMEPWREGVSEMSKVVVGQTLVKLEGDSLVCRTRECNLGNFIADGMLYKNLRNPDANKWNDVSIALMNSGGIRSTIQRGNISVGDVMTVQPFGNTVDALKLKGQHLRAALEHSVSRLDPCVTDNPFGGFLQVSGLRVKYDLSQKVGQRVVGVDVLCVECEVPEYKPLKDQQVYKLIIPSFTADGGDGFTVIRDNRIDYTAIGDLDSDVFIQYIKTRSPIYKGLEDRIEFVNDSDVCKTSADAVIIRLNSALMFLLLCCVRLFV